MIPVVDLHCDLLAFLEEKEGATIYDPSSPAPYADLQKGGVKTQILPLFTPTTLNSVQCGIKQASIFKTLLEKHPLCFKNAPSAEAIHIIPAIENASCFALEEEPFDEALNRLNQFIALIGTPLYITLTWNTENRFGGGDQTKIGLKEDGKRLLEFLNGKKIAIDFSHTSDPLAYDLFDWIDKKGLDIPVLASHSNFRSVCPHLRNLPDTIAKEIARRKGIIGLNFFAAFIDPQNPLMLMRHIEHALALGAHKALCFGADFFYLSQQVLSTLKQKYNTDRPYFDSLSNPSCYQTLLEGIQKQLQPERSFIQDLAHANALGWIKKHT
ncbi:MAG: hypothetical protein RLZZ453_430 [Chlamydiota bacterium]|jgi:microsomal dipeptidase-like Zn-dependent dipeptidase